MTTAPSPAPAAPAQSPSPSAGGGAPGGGAPGGGPQGGQGQGPTGQIIITTTITTGSSIQAPQPTPMQSPPQGQEQGQDPNGQQANQARDQQQQRQQTPAKEKGFFGKLMDAAKELFNEIKGAVKDAIGIGNGQEAQYHMSRGGKNPGQQAAAPAQSPQNSKSQSREAGSLDNLSPDARKAAVDAAMGGSKGAQHKGAASNDLKQAPAGHAQGGAKEKAAAASR